MSAHTTNQQSEIARLQSDNAALRQQLIDEAVSQVDDTPNFDLDCEPLDPNNYRERAALLHAKWILRLPPAQAHQAVAYLIATNTNPDVDRVDFMARMAGLGVNG